MRASTRRFALAGLLGVFWIFPGCSLSQSYNQCQKDADCAPVNGQKLFCTSDNLCVVGTPEAKLCQKTYPADPPPNAVPVGVLAQLATDLGGSDTLLLEAIELGVDQVNSFVGAGQRAALAEHLRHDGDRRRRAEVDGDPDAGAQRGGGDRAD